MSLTKEISLSSPLVPKNEDYRRVCELTAHVVEQCYIEKRNRQDTETSAAYIMHRVTGEPFEICEYIIANVDTTKTFTNWHKQNDTKYLDTLLDSTFQLKLRNLFVHYYTHLRQAPTIELIQQCLKKHYGDAYTAESMQPLLKAHGYIWKPLNGTSKSILVEDPKQFYERGKYLANIMKLRRSKRHFVYIDDTVLETELQTTSSNAERETLYCYAAVSSSLGLLNSATIAISSDISGSELKVPTESYVLEKVVYEIPPASVIVIPERPYHEKPLVVLPDMHASREEMLKWLQYHGIPHSEAMHRAELFSLVQRSKRHLPQEIRKFDQTLAMHGHTVLRLPRKCSFLYYFEPFWTDFTSSPDEGIPFIYRIMQALKQVSTETWVTMEQNLIDLETKTMSQDNAVETVTDQILTLARDGQLLPEDVADCDAVETDDWLHQVVYL